MQPDKAPNWLKTWWNRRFYSQDTYGIADDDCAILPINGEDLVLTMDFLNANPIIIELGIGNYKDLGYLLVCVNISDLIGTGAKPIGFLIGSMMKRTDTTIDFHNLMNGVEEALLEYKIPLIGGDTKLGNSLALNGVAVGMRELNSKLFPHSNANEGDEIWVSGNIGSVAAAICVYNKVKLSDNLSKYCIEVLKKPKVPVDKSLAISRGCFGNGGTDLSDGLSSDLRDLCKSSGVGAIIYSKLLPFDHELIELAKINKIEPWIFGLILGGDCQFIVTSNKENSSQLEKLKMIKIGEIISKKECYLDVNGSLFEMDSLGHEDGRNMSFYEEVKYLSKLLKTKIDD